jgi:hypothetical protein
MDMACKVYGEGEACTGFWWGKLRKRDQWGDQGIDRRIILIWIFRMWDVEWIELAQDRDQEVVTCECGNEPLGCIKFGEFLDWLQTG